MTILGKKKLRDELVWRVLASCQNIFVVAFFISPIVYVYLKHVFVFNHLFHVCASPFLDILLCIVEMVCIYYLNM